MVLTGIGGFIIGILFTFLVGRAMRLRSTGYYKLNRAQRRLKKMNKL